MVMVQDKNQHQAITSLLVKTVQEQQAEIQNLTQQVDDLKAKVG